MNPYLAAAALLFVALAIGIAIELLTNRRRDDDRDREWWDKGL